MENPPLASIVVANDESSQQLNMRASPLVRIRVQVQLLLRLCVLDQEISRSAILSLQSLLMA